MEGLRHLLNAIYSIKHSLTRFDISGNLGINHPSAMKAIQLFIADSQTLTDLNISHLQFSKENLKTFTKFLIGQFGKDWNLNNSLTTLKWDGDLKADKALALDFMTNQLQNVYNLKLKTISMCDVFTKQEQ